MSLDADIALYVTPSTQRLASPRKWAAAGVEMATMYQPSGDRWLDLRSGHALAPELVFLPGTLATVVTREYGDVRDRVGGHVVLVERLDGDQVHTVEGNGRGLLGDGTRGEGVVRGQRSLHSFRRVYHLGLEHFELMER